MAETRKFTQNTIAIVYDFDGTLSPQPMQEYTVLPEIGISAKDFWKEVGKETKSSESEAMLVYMRLLIEKTEEKKRHLGRKELAEIASGVKYFQGVETWFKRINEYVKAQGNNKTKVEHYIISAGMKEILDGVTI